jgi:hypothetical protein
MFTTSPTTSPRPIVTAFDNAWLTWRLDEPAERPQLSIAELAECRCPELCDRDHVNE